MCGSDTRMSVLDHGLLSQNNLPAHDHHCFFTSSTRPSSTPTPMIHTPPTSQALQSIMPPPEPALPPAAVGKGAIEKLIELITLVTLGGLLLGALYLKVYGLASPCSRRRSNSSCQSALSSFIRGAGGGRQGEEELREIMVLAKQAQVRGEIVQYGGLRGWLEHYITRKKARPAGTARLVVERNAQPETSSTLPVQERTKASAGSYFFSALMASLLAAVVLHHYNNALTS